jgi:hypothetical protein
VRVAGGRRISPTEISWTESRFFSKSVRKERSLRSGVGVFRGKWDEEDEEEGWVTPPEERGRDEEGKSRLFSAKIDEDNGGCFLPLILASRTVLLFPLFSSKDLSKLGVKFFFEEFKLLIGDKPNELKR